MKDNNTTIETLKQIIKKFNDDREWQQFHTPKSMSMHVATEAAELMELFLWSENKGSEVDLEKKRTEVENEVADIAYALLNFCQRSNIDLCSAIENKMLLNAQKYPVEKARGNSKKYTEL